jgi:hypothetical protein
MLNNISEQYINMCRQAKEIQDLWLPQDYDIVQFYDDNKFEPRYIIDLITPESRADSGAYGPYIDESSLHPKKIEDEGYWNQLIWLPRQDQLQKLLGDDAWNWFYFNYYFAEDYRNPELKFPYSSEEIGLMRLMQEVYNKKWSGQDWVI